MSKDLAESSANESGQGMVEYILMVAIVVGAFMMLMAGLSKSGLMKKMMAPLNTDFAKIYQYGHKDGDSAKHVRRRTFVELP